MSEKPETTHQLTLTPAQEKARRQRNIAIALCLVAFVAVFYVATVVKFGPEILARPM